MMHAHPSLPNSMHVYLLLTLLSCGEARQLIVIPNSVLKALKDWAFAIRGLHAGAEMSTDNFICHWLLVKPGTAASQFVSRQKPDSEIASQRMPADWKHSQHRASATIRESAAQLSGFDGKSFTKRNANCQATVIRPRVPH